MKSVYGCDPGNLIAAIGPSIGPDHFEVKEDVAVQLRSAFSTQSDQIERSDASGRIYFDLWRANQLTLENCGVDPNRIDVAGICTVCHKGDWFSHRGDSGKTGRFGVIISLDGMKQ